MDYFQAAGPASKGSCVRGVQRVPRRTCVTPRRRSVLLLPAVRSMHVRSAGLGQRGSASGAPQVRGGHVNPLHYDTHH